jgi:GNAT superfamily N-acetyltransferase
MNMRHLKSFNQLFEKQPAYTSNLVGYHSKPVGYQNKPIGYSESEEVIDKTNTDFKIDYTGVLDYHSILSVFDSVGLYTTFEPRFIVRCDSKIIGGVTYEIEKEKGLKIYNFDIALLEEYQGIGISKKLIVKVISDAETLGCDLLRAEVVNQKLEIHLDRIGFEINDIGYKKIAVMEL